MFTGIITDIGAVVAADNDGELRLVVETSYDVDKIAIGASIAHSGVCLTVIEKQQGRFVVEVSDETISCSTAGQWNVGTKLNLERALCLGDELGGHLVLGHVDGLAEVVAINDIGDSHEIIFSAPQELKYFIAAKGSVTLDGVSLTVNNVADNQFTINIIPHTWENTTFSDLSPGSKVNLEIDTMARYIARLNEGK